MIGLPDDWQWWAAGYLALGGATAGLRHALLRWTALPRPHVRRFAWLVLPSAILIVVLAMLAVDTANPNYGLTLGLAALILPIFFVPAYLVSWVGSVLATRYGPGQDTD